MTRLSNLLALAAFAAKVRAQDSTVPMSASSTTGGLSFPTGLGGSPVPFGPSPEGCSDFEILVARGTSEPGPFGVIVGDPLVSAVVEMVPGSRGYAVQYPADMSNTSVSTGVTDTLERLQSQSEACPDQKFAIVGYSQGAAVMHGAADSIPEDIQTDKILAVVMFGDPRLRLATTNPDAAAFPAALQEKLFQNCAEGDPVCSTNTTGGFTAHISYNNPGTTFQEDSANFIKAAFEGNPEPAKTTGPETLDSATATSAPDATDSSNPNTTFTNESGGYAPQTAFVMTSLMVASGFLFFLI